MATSSFSFPSSQDDPTLDAYCVAGWELSDHSDLESARSDDNETNNEEVNCDTLHTLQAEIQQLKMGTLFENSDLLKLAVKDASVAQA